MADHNSEVERAKQALAAAEAKAAKAKADAVESWRKICEWAAPYLLPGETVQVPADKYPTQVRVGKWWLWQELEHHDTPDYHDSDGGWTQGSSWSHLVWRWKDEASGFCGNFSQKTNTTGLSEFVREAFNEYRMQIVKALSWMRPEGPPAPIVKVEPMPPAVVPSAPPEVRAAEPIPVVEAARRLAAEAWHRRSASRPFYTDGNPSDFGDHD